MDHLARATKSVNTAKHELIFEPTPVGDIYEYLDSALADLAAAREELAVERPALENEVRIALSTTVGPEADHDVREALVRYICELARERVKRVKSQLAKEQEPANE